MTAGDGRLDLRGLPPPEPLEQVLGALAALPLGDVLHVVLVHEPLPLFALLPDRGFAWHCRTVGTGEVHVVLWRKGDARAAHRAEAALP